MTVMSNVSFYYYPLVNAVRFSSRRKFLYGSSFLLGTIAMLLLTIASSAGSASDKLLSSAALRSVDVQASATSRIPLNEALIRTLSNNPMIDRIYPVAVGGAGIKVRQPAVGVSLMVASDLPIQEPPIISSIKQSLFPLTNHEIVLPISVNGVSMEPLLGSVVGFALDSSGGPEGPPLVELKVVGFYNSSWQLDGHEAGIVSLPTALIFASTSDPGVTSTAAYIAKDGYSSLVVEAKNEGQVPGLLSQLSARGLYVTDYQEQVSGTAAVAKVAKSLAGIAVIGMALVLFGASLSASGTLLSSRRVEVATLRAIGFTRLQVLYQLLLELIFGGLGVALASSAAAIAVVLMMSNFFHGLILRLGLSSVNPDPRSVSIVFAIEVFAIVIGGVLAIIRPLRLQPSIALRDW